MWGGSPPSSVGGFGWSFIQKSQVAHHRCLTKGGPLTHPALPYRVGVGGFSASALLAVFFGLFLLPVLFVPYVAWVFRRHGRFSWGHAMITVTTVVYGMALWTYTILPVPDSATMSCPDGGVRPQLVPFASLADVHVLTNGLRDPGLFQLVANIALFVPFGMLVRHLVRPRRPIWVVVAALGTSLLIELTQLTGVWGIYPCAYRIFDVDDLITNTAGAAIGVWLAPLLRFVPGQRDVPADRPRVVTRGRRLVGMAADFVAVQVLTLLVYVPLGVAAKEAGWFGSPVPYVQLQGWATIVMSAVVLLLVPWFGAVPRSASGSPSSVRSAATARPPDAARCSCAGRPGQAATSWSPPSVRSRAGVS